MESTHAQVSMPTKGSRWWPFRRALLRGLAVMMPPLLTLVVFIWAWTTIDGYVLQPIESGIVRVITFAAMRSGVWKTIPADADPDGVVVLDRNGNRVPTDAVLRSAGSVQGILARAKREAWRVASFQYDGQVYVSMPDQTWIADDVVEYVQSQSQRPIPATASTADVYEQYVHMRHLPRWRTIPVFLAVFVALLYLLGRFLAAGVGRIMVNGVEALIRRLPVVRNVYSAVKQVTDFVFNEREIQFNRVVAVQYPREGIWSLGFVMGESLIDIRAAANEPVLAVLIPTSPMPATGFVVTVRKSETIDLAITLDQAIQFIVSCGVVTPPHPNSPDIGRQLSAAIAENLHISTPDAAPASPQSTPDSAQNP